MWLLYLHLTLLTFERVPQIAVSVSHLHRVSPWLLRTEAGKPLLTMSVTCVALLGFFVFHATRAALHDSQFRYFWLHRANVELEKHLGFNFCP